MGVLSGTTLTYGVGSAGGNREDLEDVIHELDPLEYYCQTNFDRVTAKATYHEHELDSTVAPASNINLEGADGSFTSIVSPTRAGNYTQILKKEFIVSDTQEVVNKAGRSSDVMRQVKKQMKELKNDFEYALVRNQASSAGDASTGRSLGSIESWIATTDNSGNGVRATTTASASTAGFSSSTVAAPTDGTTTGALTETVFLSSLELAWLDGGKDNTVLCSSKQKKVISGFTGITDKTTQVPNTTKKPVIMGSADMYVSEFGTHTIVLHRHVRDSVVLALDPDYWAIAYLRAPFIEKLAKTGDGHKRALRMEATLVSRNAAASAKVVACA